MSRSILRAPGDAYTTNGFQSLSNKETLQLRTGVAPKEPSHTKYVAPRWCPTIDVLAVPEGKAMRLVRLSGGQTIWRHSLAEPGGDRSNAAVDGQAIRAIAWHPTSTRLAVLHADGTLVQRDAAAGDVIHESEIELGEGELVAVMEWIQCGAETFENSNDVQSRKPLEHYLPRLTSADRGKAMPSHINPTTEPLTAIIIVTATGRVVVSLGGVFTLPVACAPKELEATGAKCSVVSAKLDEKDLKLYVVFSVQPPASQDPPGARLVVCALNMMLFAQTSGDLGRFTTLFSRLSGLCLYMESALDVLIKESESRAESASRPMLLDKLESVLRDHGVDEATSPEADLIRLATTGCASESVSQFLLSKMKANKLNNWESAGRLGAVAIVRLVYQHIQPAIERAILAISELQPIIGDWARRSADTPSSDDIADRLAGAGQALERAVVVWGWLFARFEEYMTAICDEQHENQEFADWALFAIDDLHWQNDGSRRLESDDADDGSRPVRPEIDYELLIKFIRSAFCRETEADPVDRSLPRMLYARRERSAESKELLHAYIKGLFRSKEAGDSQAEGDKRLGFVFHDAQLVDDALAACGFPSALEGGPAGDVQPTCREMLSEAKDITLGALRWPSSMLGNSVSWESTPLAALLSEGGEDSADERRVSDMCKVDRDGSMYIATTVASSRTLELIALAYVPTDVSYVALVDLTVLTRTADHAGAATPVHVTDVSFFDTSLLGLTFTIDGSDSLYLGTLEYRREATAGTLAYQGLDNFPAANTLQSVAKSPLMFTRLLKVADTLPSYSVALACNGNKGRRCIAVVERRGKYWWPYDMDNEEEEDDEDDDDDL
ncbi:hypothetical protein GGI20_000748 [Coemansia sp. BCRC 34301]|nr:hypothetical protein GGI20_000748 [Coemansia sp. BCRC 34301]